jgi:Phasin protein
MARNPHKTSRPENVAPTTAPLAGAMPSPQEGWVGLTRDQLDFALQSATAWLRGVEALRKVEWDMTHIALKRYEEIQQRLHQTSDLSGLIALQVELMRFDSAAAIKSAQELYDAAVQSATEALVKAKSTMDASQGDSMKSWMESMQSLIHTGVRPLDDLFGSSILRDLMKVPGAPTRPA